MANWLVTIKYISDERVFFVEDFEHPWQARKYVLQSILGYDPGKPIKVEAIPLVETPNRKGNPHGYPTSRITRK